MSGTTSKLEKQIVGLNLSDEKVSGELSDEDLELKVARLSKNLNILKQQKNRKVYQRRLFDGEIKLMEKGINLKQYEIEEFKKLLNDSCAEDAAIEVVCLKKKLKMVLLKKNHKEFQIKILDGKIKLLNQKIKNIDMEINEYKADIKMDVEMTD